jgi:malonate transporter and related proteins
MLSTVAVVLPIFALVATGWIARRCGALGANATSEVNRFVVYLALPALLFDIVATARFEEIWRPGFIAAFGIGCGAVFVFTLLLRMRQGAPMADAAIDGLNASYANTGYMGFPLLLAAVGEAGLAPALIATIFTVCILFAVAIVLIESGLQTAARRRDIARRTAFALMRNPLLVAPALGVLAPLSGASLPGPVASYLSLLGGAASPCALIALGLFLADRPQEQSQTQPGLIATLVGLKLFAQPGLTWLIAGPLLGLPPLTTHAAVLLAALPTGTGPFMLAEFYGRGARTTARTVLVTTLLSVLTLTAYLLIAAP